MFNEAENTAPAAEPATGEENAAEIPAAETAPPAVESGENGQHKPSWEELLRDPVYKSRYDQAVQGIVKARLRGRAQAEEKLARLAPVLSALEERYGLTDGSDAEALARNLREGADAYRPRGQEIAAHLDGLLSQARVLQKSVPDFDLRREMEDAEFVRMTAPHSGVSLADAYFARHRAEREQAAARGSLEAISRSLQSAGARPRELRETGAGGRFTLDPRSMSREEREALKKRILEAKAQGRKLGVGE